jgi:hypothetical protein
MSNGNVNRSPQMRKNPHDRANVCCFENLYLPINVVENNWAKRNYSVLRGDPVYSRVPPLKAPKMPLVNAFAFEPIVLGDV